MAALLIVGCAHAPKVPFAASAAELRPEVSPGTLATLRLGGGELKGSPGAMEFDVAITHTGNALTLSTGGEALEREVYEASDAAYRIAEAGDEAFVPEIDLVRYPVRPGDGWEWSGRVVYAGLSRPAHARVGLSVEGEELRSDVRLSVAAGGGRPDSERRLGFWFRKGHGVVRRDFGVSSRRPKGEAWRP